MEFSLKSKGILQDACHQTEGVAVSFALLLHWLDGSVAVYQATIFIMMESAALLLVSSSHSRWTDMMPMDRFLYYTDFYSSYIQRIIRYCHSMLVRSSIVPSCCKSRGCAANKSWGIWESNSFGRTKRSHYCFGLRPRGKQGFISFLLLHVWEYETAKNLIYIYWHLVGRCWHDSCCNY